VLNSRSHRTRCGQRAPNDRDQIWKLAPRIHSRCLSAAINGKWVQWCWKDKSLLTKKSVDWTLDLQKDSGTQYCLPLY